MSKDRSSEPIETMPDMAGNLCLHCGTITSFEGRDSNGRRRYVCAMTCGQRYVVEPARELAEFEPSEMAMKEASQADLDHLFGKKPSPYPDFGTF